MLFTIKKLIQENINKRNRKRLSNTNPTLICSNCTGGFLYHWLGLKFNSPFINLYLSPNDFVTMLENFEEFISTPLKRKHSEKYPIGEGILGIEVHFVHYENWDQANTIWEKRKKRIDRDNIGIMLTNWCDSYEVLKRFDELPFKHKVVFTDKPYPEIKSSYYIKGLKIRENRNLYATQYITGKRYIDQFDYVKFINELKNEKEI